MSRVATLLAVLSSSLVGANWTCEKKSKLHGWNTAFALTHNSKPASQETSPGDIMTWHALVLDPANDDDKVAEITGAAINARRLRSSSVDRPWTGRGDAVAATWIVPGDESRRRRGRATWIFGGDGSRRRRGRDVDSPWRRVAAMPRLRRG